MVDKFYVPYMEASASDWSPNCVVKYEDYAALKELTDKLVKLRQGGCMSFSEQKALDDLLRGYKRD